MSRPRQIGVSIWGHFLYTLQSITKKTVSILKIWNFHWETSGMYRKLNSKFIAETNGLLNWITHTARSSEKLVSWLLLFGKNSIIQLFKNDFFTRKIEKNKQTIVAFINTNKYIYSSLLCHYQLESLFIIKIIACDNVSLPIQCDDNIILCLCNGCRGNTHTFYFSLWNCSKLGSINWFVGRHCSLFIITSCFININTYYEWVLIKSMFITCSRRGDFSWRFLCTTLKSSLVLTKSFFFALKK